MSKFAVKVDLSDIQGKLLTLGTRLGNAVGRRGLLAGAKIIGEEARRLAPQPRARSKRARKKLGPIPRGEKGYWARGNLVRAIGWETRGVFRDGSGTPVGHQAVVLVKKAKKGGRNVRSYAHIVEGGSQPHSMGKGAITTVFKRSKAKPMPVGARHPGAKAQPFMKPAFYTKAGEAVRVIQSVTRQELQKELAALRTRPKSAGRVA